MGGGGKGSLSLETCSNRYAAKERGEWADVRRTYVRAMYYMASRGMQARDNSKQNMGRRRRMGELSLGVRLSVGRRAEKW